MKNVDDPADGTEQEFSTTQNLRVRLVRLLKEKRYEEALEVLYRARAEAPDDKELVISIARIKEFLVGSYAKKLGGLDRVAGPIPVASARSPDALLIAKYIDGVSTFGDIAKICPLGQLQTLSVLVSLYGTQEPPKPTGTTAPIINLVGSATAPGTKKLDRSPVESPQIFPNAKRDEVIGTHNQVGDNSAVTPATRYELPKPPESQEDRNFREAFAGATTAFVQRRYEEARQHIDICLKLRPNDPGTLAILRRIDREQRS